MKRDVVRLVTPGTLTEDTLLEARRNNYLATIARAKTSSTTEADSYAIAWIDISTGEFRVIETDGERIGADLARIDPAEIVVHDALLSEPDLREMLAAYTSISPMPRDVFDGATAERRLAAFFAVKTLDGFGAFSRLALTAAAAAVTYVEAHPDRGAAALVAAGCRGAWRFHADRCGDPRQS